jgi:hypothetical protein
VLTHFLGMTWVRHYFRNFWARANHTRARRQVMVGIVAIMMITHCAEILIWALFFFLRGIVPSWFEGVFFSISSYTTLGDSGIVLSDHWRGLGGFEALSAMLMIGWSTAMLASVVLKLHSLDD